MCNMGWWLDQDQIDRLSYRNFILFASLTLSLLLLFSVIYVIFSGNHSFVLLQYRQTADQVVVLSHTPEVDEDMNESFVMTPHDFSYVINNASVCDTGVRHLMYVIYVESAPENFFKRAQIRETWGYRDILKHVTGRVVFLLGFTEDDVIQKAIVKESEKYGDVVQMDFVDSYMNLTIKSVMALKWVMDYCSGAEFVIKADDDTLVNILGLVRILGIMVRPSRRTFFCFTWGRAPVGRYGKWKVPFKQYPFSKYPRACNGPLYILPKAQIQNLYQQSFKVPYISVEDQYVTGLLASAVGRMRHVSPIGFLTFPWGLSLYFYENTFPPPLVSVPQDDLYLHAWKLTINRMTKQSKQLFSDEYMQYFNKIFRHQ